ncbi:MAG: Pili and flagellar-assembly chaperone, PapD N-terminal domain [Pseudomonadota bacterium]
MVALLIWAWWLWLLMALLTPLAQAALTISPPQLTPDEDGVVVTQVQSSLAQPSRWSVRLVDWNVEGNAFPPAEGQISPRFFSLQPGDMQVIRARPRERSRYHRLVIEQVPPDDLQQGLSFQFRFSLPVFRSHKEPVRLALEWPAQGGCLSYQNQEPLAVQLLLPAEATGQRTLLPGQRASLCPKSPALKTGSP